MFWFHSFSSPTERIPKKKIKYPLKNGLCPAVIPTKNGKRIIISTSKITKIKARIKNRKEKGRRDSIKVENPHSKGLCSSRSKNTFLDKNIPNPNKIRERPKLNENKTSNIIIGKSY